MATLTSHGNEIFGVPDLHQVAAINRWKCKGIGQCSVCSVEAGDAWNAAGLEWGGKKKLSSNWAIPPNAKRAAAGYPEFPEVRLAQEFNPDSLINMFRMWLAKKIDVGPVDGSYWCLDCALNEGKTFVQYTTRMEIIQDHLARHSPDDHVRIRSAVPGKEE